MEVQLQGNLEMWATIRSIAESARKHGVSDEDILQAYANPIRVFDLDEVSRWSSGPTSQPSSTRSVSSTVSRQRSSSMR